MMRINYKNSLLTRMVFTQQSSSNISAVKQQISFLDTTVKINDNRELCTILYEKPTDTHLYLHYTYIHTIPQAKLRDHMDSFAD